MLKKIVSLIAVLVIGSAFAQTPDLTQKNSQKIDELKARLDSLENDTVLLNGNQETIIPRIVELEKRVDKIELDLVTIKLQNEEILAQLKKLNAEKSTDASLSTAESELSKTKYYAVIESQKTMARAQEALDKHSATLSDKLRIERSKSNKWYYLILSEGNDYQTTKRKIKELKKLGFRDAWCVSGLNLG
jgi:chromosome segregation ATPase